jgi:hypothetical protein
MYNSSHKEDYRVPYKKVLEKVLFSPGGLLRESRYINLFRSARADALNIITLYTRILFLLDANKMLKANNLINELNKYGIPVESTIAAINTLSLSNKQLIWLSKNKDIEEGFIGENQYITISERGLSYIRHLLQNFEYLWVCGLDRTSLYPAKEDFPGRLYSYKRLLIDYSDSEWKEITFRLAANYVLPFDARSTSLPVNFICVDLFCRTILESLKASRAAVVKSKEENRDDSYRKRINEELIDLSNLFSTIIERAKRLGIAIDKDSKYYLMLDEVMNEIEIYINSNRKNFATSVTKEWEETIQKWKRWEKPIRKNGINEVTDDIVSWASIYLKKFLPNFSFNGLGLNDYISGLDNAELFSRNIRIFAEKKDRFLNYLSNELPLYNDFVSKYNNVFKALKQCIRIHETMVGVATGSQIYDWLKMQEEFIEDTNEELHVYKIAEMYDSIKMSNYADAWIKAQKILELYSSIFSYFVINDGDFDSDYDDYGIISLL